MKLHIAAESLPINSVFHEVAWSKEYFVWKNACNRWPAHNPLLTNIDIYCAMK